MTDDDLGVTYWLPRTEFTVELTNRTTLKSTDRGTFPAEVVDASVKSALVRDIDGKRTLFVKDRWLKKSSVEIELDDHGFIKAINSETSRDIAPILSVIGKAIDVLGPVTLGMRRIRDAEDDTESLEAQWASEHAQLDAHREELEKRVGERLAQLSAAEASSQDVASIGAALEVLQANLAAINDARRSWIASHAVTQPVQTWRLGTDDLLTLSEEFPRELRWEPDDLPPGVREMADKGALVALWDESRSTTAPPPTGSVLRDQVVLRRSRPVSIGVYVRLGEGQWQLDTSSIQHLDVVDGFSEIDYLPIRASWFRTRSLKLEYHPDGSVKVFGRTSTPSAASIATSIGGIADSAVAAKKLYDERPTIADVELEQAKARLDLLKTTSEYESLTATQARAVELSILAQQKAIRDATK